MNTFFKTRLASLALLAALASGCASSGGQPYEIASVEATPSAVAVSGFRARALECPAPKNEVSARASRCARAELMRTVGPSVPSLAF